MEDFAYKVKKLREEKNKHNYNFDEFKNFQYVPIFYSVLSQYLSLFLSAHVQTVPKPEDVNKIVDELISYIITDEGLTPSFKKAILPELYVPIETDVNRSRRRYLYYLIRENVVDHFKELAKSNNLPLTYILDSAYTLINTTISAIENLHQDILSAIDAFVKELGISVFVEPITRQQKQFLVSLGIDGEKISGMNKFEASALIDTILSTKEENTHEINGR
ncbi:MAG: hypothetical protein QXP36_00215 [Conexivisphaerales archaeon]